MIKPGADITGIRPEIVLAIVLAQPIFAAHGVPLVITSVMEGKHSRGSLHYVGLAVDLRVNDLPPSEWEIVTDQVKAALGPQFDVVLEKDHLHVEFQPKERIA